MKHRPETQSHLIEWEFISTVLAALAGVGLAVTSLRHHPLVGAMLVFGTWLGLLAIVYWLDWRARRTGGARY